MDCRHLLSIYYLYILPILPSLALLPPGSACVLPSPLLPNHANSFSLMPRAHQLRSLLNFRAPHACIPTIRHWMHTRTAYRTVDSNGLRQNNPTTCVLLMVIGNIRHWMNTRTAYLTVDSNGLRQNNPTCVLLMVIGNIRHWMNTRTA